jgi:hypothetical protein
VIRPELHAQGEPKRGIRSAPETRRRIGTLDDAVRYVSEHKKGRDLADRKRVIHQLENARTREQMLDAINTFSCLARGRGPAVSNHRIAATALACALSP